MATLRAFLFFTPVTGGAFSSHTKNVRKGAFQKNITTDAGQRMFALVVLGMENMIQAGLIVEALFLS